MKLSALAVPVLLVALTLIAVWGLGMLAIRANALSTEASVQLLRTHLEAVRLHDQLLRHTRADVEAELEKTKRLAPRKPTPEPAADETSGAVRPWP